MATWQSLTIPSIPQEVQPHTNWYTKTIIRHYICYYVSIRFEKDKTGIEWCDKKREIKKKKNCYMCVWNEWVFKYRWLILLKTKKQKDLCNNLFSGGGN